MLDQIRGRGCSRAFAAVALLALGACAEGRLAPAGPAQVEVVGALARATACEAAGELRLQGLAGSASLVVSGAELCAGWPRRQELPAGLYELSWQPAVQADQSELAAAWPLGAPAVVSLLPGRLTRLRVQLGSQAETSGATSGTTAEHRPDPARAESACSYAAERSGAS